MRPARFECSSRPRVGSVRTRAVCRAALVVLIAITGVSPASGQTASPGGSLDEPHAGAAKLHRWNAQVVQAYYPYYRMSQFPPGSLDFGGLTHVSHARIASDEAGNLVLPVPFLDPVLNQRVHAAGARILVSVGASQATKQPFERMLSDPAARTQFIAQLQAFLNLHQYDGVDIDYEFPTNAQQRDGLTYLVQEMRASFGPALEIDVVVPGNTWQAVWFDVAAMVAFVDYWYVMEYDWTGPWSAVAGHNTPLHDPGCGSSGWIDSSVAYWQSSGVPAARLVLGLAFYGRSFDSGSACQPFASSAALTYAAIEPLVGNGYSYSWHPTAKVPFLEQDTGSQYITYDDPRSLREKVRFAASQGLAGVFVWELTQDLNSNCHLLLPTVLDAVR